MYLFPARIDLYMQTICTVTNISLQVVLQCKLVYGRTESNALNNTGKMNMIC